MRVDVFVHGTVLAAQETEQTRSTFGRELAVEYYNERLLILLVARGETVVEERVFSEHVQGAANVARFELVWVARVHDYISAYRFGELAVQ